MRSNKQYWQQQKAGKQLNPDQIVVNNLASKSGHNWIIGSNLAEKVKFDTLTLLCNYRAINF